MKKKIETANAPKALGPYSQAISQTLLGGELLFVSGQLPIDPATGTLIRETIEECTVLVMQNIQAILQASGMSLTHIVKVEIFLKDMEDFPAFNKAYAQFFDLKAPPARQTIQAAKLPMDSPIEISCIACRPHQ